jgi:hypothetical protein
MAGQGTQEILEQLVVQETLELQEIRAIMV